MKSAPITTRFLLIARENQWFEKLYSNPDIREYSYLPAKDGKLIPLDLSKNELDNDIYKDIIEEFRSVYYPDKELNEENFESVMELAQKISPINSIHQTSRRCLFIMLVADAFLNGKYEQSMDSNDLLVNYFERTNKHIKEIRNDAPINEGLHLLAFATALNGLNIEKTDNLPEFIKNDIQSINNIYKNREERAKFLLQISDGCFDSSTEIIHPIEPDVIGEYLFLWQLLKQTLEKDKWLDYLCSKAYDNNDETVSNFFERCFSDWKELGNELNKEIAARLGGIKNETY